MAETSPHSFPLLEELLRLQGASLQPYYTNADAARIFNVSPRTIQTHVANGSLPSRKLMGRARFLSCDLESFLTHGKRFGRE